MVESEKTKNIKFDVTRRLLTKDYRIAESSNSAAIVLMSEFAVDQDGEKIPADKFIEIVDETDEMEFWELWMRFRASALKKVSARR